MALPFALAGLLFVLPLSAGKVIFPAVAAPPTMQDCTCAVPNAFSPNGDSNNDLFQPLFGACQPADYEIHIFSRGGQLVFTSTDPAAGWDGSFQSQPMAQGVYVYLVRYRMPEQETGVVETKAGEVVLIR